MSSRATAGATDYPAYVVIGVFLFDFFSACFQTGCPRHHRQPGLVQSLSFPRISLPLAVVVEQFYTLLLSMIVMFGILIVMGHFPSWHWLLMIPLVALFTLFNTGVALFTARLTVHFRDLTQILPFVVAHPVLHVRRPVQRGHDLQGAPVGHPGVRLAPAVPGADDRTAPC